MNRNGLKLSFANENYYTSFKKIKNPNTVPAAIAIGSFDGVHLGHQSNHYKNLIVHC